MTTKNRIARNHSATIRTIIVALVAALALAACGGQEQTLQPDRIPASGASPSSGSADDQAAGGLIESLPIERYSESSTRAIVVSDGVEVFDRPDGLAITTLAPTTTFGTTRVMLAEETEGDWVRVRLPARPNHRTGWIRSAEVQLEAVDLEVTIDLQSRTMVVRSGIDMVMESSVAIGSDENPTPTGTFYVTDKLETPDPTGAYGPYAFGLSGYSETLTEFAGGDGQIGIHGTNDPDSIGEAVSHGCIRLPNELVSQLAETLPLGTPVHIV
jgi:lipoprotein-anchoring transpeptidase ErfK/SrfK